MQQSIDKTAKPIEPLYDTWSFRSAGDNYWWINPPPFKSNSTAEINSWFATTAKNTLDAFFELARVWKVYIAPNYQSEIGGMVLEWKPGESYENYVENAIHAIREFPASISEVELQVDMFVYVRTQSSPNQPVRGWVRYLGDFSITDLMDCEYGLSFGVHHSLFCSDSHEGDNRELYYLNQPFVSYAFKQWQEKCGAINETQGQWTYEYGFLPSEDTLPIDLLFDTWSNGVGSFEWQIKQPFNFSSVSAQTANTWFIKVMTDALEAFSDLARVYELEFSSDRIGDLNLQWASDIARILRIDDPDWSWSTSHYTRFILTWKPEVAYEEYLKTVVKFIDEYPIPIYSPCMSVELFVYFRKQQSPDEAIRDWARFSNRFELRLDSEKKTGFCSFTIHHTLFCLQTKGKPNNSELYALNQPLLKNALQRWEDRSGSISNNTGKLGMYKYGFKPD